jgi:actin-like ATPase involved in cell morphogenesis
MTKSKKEAEFEKIRRHKRYNISWRVELRAVAWTDALHLVTDNISRGGFFVRTAEPTEVGTRVEILLKLPDDTTLQVEGTIVHSIPAERASGEGLAPGFGIRIDEKHAIDLSLLESIVASHGGGEHSLLIDEQYITLPAILFGADDGKQRITTAHHLVSVPEDDDPEIPLEVTAPESSAGKTTATVKRTQPDDCPCVFGVDFGTSYTSIALAHSNKVEVFPDEQGRPMIPSVVCYPESGAPLVGWPAREKLVTNPATTISSPKRLIGRRYDHPKIHQLLSSTPVHMIAGPNGLVVSQIYGETLAIPQVCSEIFRRIAEVGTRGSGQPVQQIVISTPVGYQEERRAIVRSAQLAGLQVLGMIDEPVAAALAYGLGREGGKRVAVYDFGGGTFDFSLLQINHGGGVEILGSAGDPWLGGDDFDHAIAEHAANIFWKQRKVDLRSRQVEWQVLLFLAENAKLKLSVEREVELCAKSIVLSIHGPIDLQVKITRELYAELCRELVDRSIQTMDSCIELAGLCPSDIDHVVLTGGMSRSPIVRQRLQEYFQRELPLMVDPELAIVTGNAIYGRYLAQQSNRGHTK